jgi:uncharacterized protein
MTHTSNTSLGTKLKIKLVPKSSENRISEYMSDGTIKIKLTAPPADNKANKALVSFLAKQLNLHKKQIEITSGLKSRNKTILLKNTTKKEIENAINNIISRRNQT